tara:strand:+ start:1428 stop:2819 length:1392 start_codon:yes stop_codon:yes gene_type:complete
MKLDGYSYTEGKSNFDLEKTVRLIHKLLPLSIAYNRFHELHALDQVDVFLRLDHKSQKLLYENLDLNIIGKLNSQLQVNEIIKVIDSIDDDRLAKVLDNTNSNISADILQAINNKDIAKIVSQMAKREDVEPLLGYDDNVAGGLMATELLAVRDDLNIGQILSVVKNQNYLISDDDFSYLFVIDSRGILKGIVDNKVLLTSNPNTYVSFVMKKEFISVKISTNKETCIKLMKRYNLHFLPVTDFQGKLVGVLNLTDVINIVQNEATEDMYKMIGIAGKEHVLGPFWSSVRHRLPWLSINLMTTILAGMIVTMFEGTISRAVVLAIFLPIISGQGGIAGSQTVILIVREIALGNINTRDYKKLLVKEINLGLVHGFIMSLAIGIIAWFWKDSFYLSLAVAIAMMFALIVAAISGVLIPISLKILRIDPALGSAVAVTTLTEIIGFFIYLSLAWYLINLIERGLA